MTRWYIYMHTIATNLNLTLIFFWCVCIYCSLLYKKVPVKFLHEQYFIYLRSGHALHSENWLERAYTAMGGDLPFAWPHFRDGEEHRYVPQGSDGLRCGVLLLKFEHKEQWVETVRSHTGCTVAPTCILHGREVKPQLSSNKWYADKKQEFLATLQYPLDLATIFKEGQLRKFLRYNETPPGGVMVQ